MYRTDLNARSFDPRAKAVVYLVVTVLVIAVPQPWAAAVALVGAIMLLAGLGLLRRWIGVLRALVPTLVLFALVVGLSAGAAAGLSAALRLLALAATGFVFFATTPPDALGDALVASGMRPQWAFLLEGTLRFVPTMALLLREVRDAQASRGVRFDGWHLVRNGVALLGPLLLSALRLADDLAEALESRGFGNPHHTALGTYRLRWHDWLLMITSVGAALIGWFSFA